MLSSGIFPTQLKFAEVIPIFKKGDKMPHLTIDPFPYLHHFQRFLKKLFIIEFFYHINHNHILVNEQFGFRHGISTDVASFNLTKNILTALNN
jgi:hypothetical protein